ncbi:hypothetical protein [Devosia sp.]|uniref:hypothetical protein n=1 Tax=Devosia sp. TaxID=1871048 RepID=UPI003BA9B3FB
MSASLVTTPAPQVPKLGPFRQRPGKYLRQEFLDWVRETGKPDTWQHHDPSRPPSDQEFEAIVTFVIPESVRSRVGMASCPICSPSAPKYFSGTLAWFPSEGVLRAIGNECAKSHFGVERVNAAIAAGKRQAAVGEAQYFLLDALPLIAPLRDEVQKLHAAAADVDRLRQLFWHASSKTACHKLAKMGAGGLLEVERVKSVEAVDSQGQDTTRFESEVVASYQVDGLAFINRSYLVAGLARQTADALALVEAADEHAALDFILDRLKVDAHLYEAERLARNALDQFEKLKEAIVDARQFLSINNLNSLSEYSRQNRGGSPVTFHFNPAYPARVRVKGANKNWCEISIPPTLR